MPRDNILSERDSPPSEVAEPTAKPQFRPDVEGMRAIAVGLVLVYHAFAHPFTGGCVGVDVFFVISGFLITSLLLRENIRSGRISISDFYARRVRRILPAATVVVLATLFFAYVFLGFVTGNSVADDARWTAVFGANFHFGHIGTDYLSSQMPASPLDHMWSLGVEEQFYVLWPLLFLALVLIVRGPRHRGGLAAILGAIIVASLAWSIIGTHTNATWAYLSPLTRAWELALGALIAVATPWIARIPRDWILEAMAVAGIVGIFAGSLLLNARTPYPGSAVALPVLSSGLLIAAGCAKPGTFVGRILATRPMQWVGARSFSLYIWHWPVLCLAALYAGHDLGKVQNATLLAVTVVLAALSYALLENPVRHSKRLAARTRTTLAVGVALIVTTIAIAQLMIVAHHGSPDGTTTTSARNARDRTFATGLEVVAAVTSARNLTAVPGSVVSDLTRPETAVTADGFDCTQVDDGGTGATSFGECAFGAPAGNKLAVIYGDSRAEMWSVPIANVAAENGWKIRVFALGGCSAPNLSFLSTQLDSPNTKCDEYHRAAVAAIVALKPQLIITTSAADQTLADGTDPSPEQWADGWKATYAALAPAGARLAMMGDMPTWANDDAHCLAKNPTKVQDCAAAADEAAPGESWIDAERSAVESTGGLYVSPAQWVCTDMCEPVIADMRVYANRYHFTAAYADYLTGVVGEALQPVMG